jgi:hypothetical protein
MLYAILCYNSEQEVDSWSKEQDDAVMGRLIAVQEPMARRGKLGPVARLHSTGTARTLRKDRHPFVVTDGPFAEAKEVILGFYVIDCDSDEEAMAFARELGEANPGGSLEVRPVSFFQPGTIEPGEALVQPRAFAD